MPLQHQHPVILLDAEGVHRHRARVVIGLQDQVEALGNLVTLLDDVACNTFPDDDSADLRQATTAMAATTASVLTAAVGICVGLGELRALAALEGISFDDPENGDQGPEDDAGDAAEEGENQVPPSGEV